ncbi:hypothetical protein LEN26_000121 [Aphanomyces euteiches]|nr:hypothetical protein AeMF1_009321 [Aphanomyces euteiches]KAH9157478.1 hypothetical protein AeRB84_000677 [Aphanomyces euteiches]KAH9164252.1 hypothetical protein LEN26_000121 [Aphanomyces euteiches]KAH9197639.1 hypothetical protein AeNC1_000385 [Aphanomyces euteiches]
MSESKMADEEEYLSHLPQVDILRVDVSPNPTHVSDELNLEVDFSVSKDVANGWWEIEVPIALYRGKVEVQDYKRGENHFQFSVPQINVDPIKPSNLANCGLLIASFKNDEGDIMDLKMVVQVSKQGDSYQRIIYNPLE